MTWQWRDVHVAWSWCEYFEKESQFFLSRFSLSFLLFVWFGDHPTWSNALKQPRSKAVKEVMEYVHDRNSQYANSMLACEAGVLQEEDRNTFWLNLGPSPRRECEKNPMRVRKLVVKYLDG